MRGFIRSVLITVLAAWLVVPAQLEAQRGREGRRGPAERARLEQRVRAQMGRMMQERLGLDEEQAERLSDVVQDFQSQRVELSRLERETRRQVEALIRGGNGDDQEARLLLDRMSELRLQEANLFRAEQDALLSVLTPAQVLQLQELREDLGRRIRALRGGRDQDSGRRRGRDR